MEQMHIAHSEALYDRAKELMPGGVNSPVRAFQSVGGTPRFIQRAKDQYLYDEDGNVYIDYIGSWGPMILGHAREEVVRAVTTAAVRGTSFGAPTNGEVELAEMIRNAVPSMEMMRMVYLKGSGIGDIVQQLCVLSCFATILYSWAIHSYRKQQ